MRWTLFCTVVDNYGDIGVAWRLARQLAAEQRARVRLWVDDLGPFARLCPALDPALDAQTVQGIEVRRWTDPLPAEALAQVDADVVVELFGCHLPEAFVAAMAARRPPPAWLNLEYLSAEAWVEDCHRLPSRHPRLPLTKTFYYPGFTARTGGLLRERDLFARRDAFAAGAGQRAAFEARLGLPARVPGRLRVSLFCYPFPALDAWLRGLCLGGPEDGLAGAAGQATELLVPPGVAPEVIANFLGSPLNTRDIRRVRALTLVGVPFLPQPDYDPLLWLCDVNVVRGEDSFVRAQWAGKPFVWHIYPQHDGVHLAKLEAFLARYLDGLPSGPSIAIGALMRAWNTGEELPRRWFEALAWLEPWRAHALAWAQRLATQPDLAAQLARCAHNGL